MGISKIEWTERTWNPVTGCTKISEGCQHCYAERMSKRLAGRCGYDKDTPFRVTLHPDKLDEPLRWKKPSKIFVCSMGDLFHKDVYFKWIRSVFEVIGRCPQHTFLILTKRPEFMQVIITALVKEGDFFSDNWHGLTEAADYFPNLWLGVTAENQQRADERIPILLQIPAAKRFVSVEPMLGAVDLRNLKYDNDILDALAGEYLSTDGSEAYVPWNKLDWSICGGETGPKARPMHPDWVRSLRDQCQEAGTPFFFKQWGAGVEIGSGLPGHPRREAGYDFKNRKGGRLLDGVEWNEYPKEVTP
jgi:protein gp37